MNRILENSIAFALFLVLIWQVDSTAQWDLYPTASLVTQGNPHDVYVEGNYAFLGDWGAGFSVIDISNIWNPSAVYNYDTPGLANSVYVDGSLAAVADWSHGVAFFDITLPTSPLYLSSWDSPGATYNVYISGDYAYIADFYSGLIVLDISDLANPVLASTYPLDGLATGISGRGDYIYITEFPTDILAFDISDPTAPQPGDTYATNGDAFNITIDGDYLFLADGTGGVKILSILNPSDFIFITSVNTLGYVNDVAISDTLMYTAEDSSGISVYSISDIWSPRLIASYDTPRRAKGIFALGLTAFVGDAGSFMIFLLDDGSTAIEEEGPSRPEEFTLDSVYPNPFNPDATISFSLKNAGIVKLTVYNVLGEMVDSEYIGRLDPGSHLINWNGKDHPSGLYFFSLGVDGASKVAKASLLK